MTWSELIFDYRNCTLIEIYAGVTMVTHQELGVSIYIIWMFSFKKTLHIAHANWLTFLPFKDKMKSFLKKTFSTPQCLFLFLLPLKLQGDSCPDVGHVVIPFRLVYKGNNWLSRSYYILNHKFSLSNWRTQTGIFFHNLWHGNCMDLS
jgi:hypothetical protein